MEPTMPTSFIPKRPVSADALVIRKSSRHSVGLLSLITTVIVIATIASFVGVYLYTIALSKQKATLAASVDETKNGIGTDFLTDMKRLNARIEGVKMLLQSHVVISPIFAALQTTTLRSVQFKTFSYAFVTDPGTKQQMVEVDLSGTAKSYATIALQSDAFSQSPLIKNPVFSNLTVDDKNGNVNFKLTFTVSPSDLSYEKFITTVTPVNAAPTPANFQQAAPSASQAIVPTGPNLTTPAKLPATTL